MKTTTKSKILLSVLILAGISPSCWLMTIEQYRILGILLLLVGIGLLGWTWRPHKGEK